MNKWIRWGPAVVWMLVIFFLSGRTGGHLNTLLPVFKKVIPSMEGFDWGHFFAYFILAATYYWGFGKTAVRYRIIAVALCVLYGITDEFHQSFVPGRTPDVMDIRNDAIGAALAMLLISVPPVRRYVHRRRDANKY